MSESKAQSDREPPWDCIVGEDYLRFATESGEPLPDLYPPANPSLFEHWLSQQQQKIKSSALHLAMRMREHGKHPLQDPGPGPLLDITDLGCAIDENDIEA